MYVYEWSRLNYFSHLADLCVIIYVKSECIIHDKSMHNYYECNIRM